MAHWDDLLDDYEARIRILEDAVRAGEVPPPMPWAAPEPPPAAPTQAQRVRADGLRARALACQQAAREMLADTGRKLRQIDRAGTAARTYARHTGA